MPFNGKVGDTFHLTDTGGSHRYVILTKQNSDGNVVIVNFTSARYWKEWLVTFTPKDDRDLFVVPKTTVNYADAHIVPFRILIDRVEQKSKSDYKFCAENHVRKIVVGAFQSKLTPIEVLTELSIQYPNECRRHYEKD